MTDGPMSSGEAVLGILRANGLVYASVGDAFLVGLFCSRSRTNVVMCDRRWSILIVVNKDLVVAYLCDS